MNLDKWKSSSILKKIGTVCVALSAIVGLILGFILIDDLSDAFDMLPIDISGWLVLYLLLWYGIDFVVTIGLLFLGRWARSLAIWWGILSLLTIIMQREYPTAIFISYILSVIAGVCLLLAKKDFKKQN